MSEEVLTLALAKGRLAEQTFDLLEKMGIGEASYSRLPGGDACALYQTATESGANQTCALLTDGEEDVLLLCVRSSFEEAEAAEALLNTLLSGIGEGT